MIQLPAIYQVKITLEKINPPVWRRLLVPMDLFLHDFHKVIQTAMGWENAHLHQFEKNGRTFGIADDEFEVSDKFMDYTFIRLADIMKHEGDSITYTYDFGDSWKHDILLEKITTPVNDIYYPSCIDGQRNCPPEDCGGAFGYLELLKVINKPEHPERQNIVEWLGEDFDPEEFNIEIINELLMEDDFGCLPLID